MKTSVLSLQALISQNDYFFGLLIPVQLIALFVAIRHYRRQPTLRVFAFYIFWSLLEMWMQYITRNLVSLPLSRRISAIDTNLFMFFEFTVVTLYITRQLTSRLRKNIVAIDAVFFFLCMLWLVIRNPGSIFHIVFFFYESFFLLLSCLLYIYDVFVNPPPGRLTDYPSFWIVTGFLILNGCSVPLLIPGELVRQFVPSLYDANFILYMILFSLLMRAYLCPPVNRTANARA